MAAITFTTLRPDTHTAGAIVGQLLRILHGMGLVSGLVTLALLALAPAWNIYKPRAVLAPMGLLVLMIACTVYSQFVIIPAMEKDPHRRWRRHRRSGGRNPSRVHLQQAAQPERASRRGNPAIRTGNGRARRQSRNQPGIKPRAERAVPREQAAGDKAPGCKTSLFRNPRFTATACYRPESLSALLSVPCPLLSGPCRPLPAPVSW